MINEFGSVTNVYTMMLGSELVQDANAGDSILYMNDVSDLDPNGGALELVSQDGSTVEAVTYSTVDYDGATVTLDAVLTEDFVVDDRVDVYPRGSETYAQVAVAEDGDAITVRVPHALETLFPEGVRDQGQSETVQIESVNQEWVITDVLGKTPVMDGSYIDPETLPDPLSDGLPPASSPTPVVTGGIGAFHVRWIPIENHDPVTYKLHMGTSAAFSEGPATVYVATMGASATVTTLPAGGAISVGTTYYFKIVASDEDGDAAVSSEVSAQLNGALATLQADLDAAEAAVAAAQAAIDVLEDTTIPGLEADIAANTAAVAAAQADVDAAEADIATLQTDLDAAEADLATAQSDLATAQAAITTLTGTTIPALQSALDAAEADILASQGDITALQGDLTAAEADIADALADIATLNTTTLPDLQDALDAAEAAVIAAQAAADAAQATADGILPITETDISDDAITTPKIAANAVTASEIAANAVTAAKIDALAVTTAKLDAGAVTAAKIAAHTITANEIAANTITANEVAANTLTANEIAANAITTSELNAGAVTTAKIAAGAVTATEIAADTITASQIAANAITASEIATDAVTAVKIQAGAVVAGKIAADAVTATEIAANAVTTTELNAGAVTTAKIAAGAVTAVEIAADTITAAQIAANAITASELAANSVTAAKIVAGTITATELAAGSVTTAKIAAGAVTANEIAAGTITATQIASSYLYAGNITVDQLTGGTLSADVTLSSTISTATSGARVEMGPFGLVLYGSDGTPSIVLPTGVGQSSTFKGNVEAGSLTVTGDATFRSNGNEVARGGSVTLNSTLTPPKAPPTLVGSWSFTDDTHPSGYQNSPTGLVYSSSNWYSVGTAAGNYAPKIISHPVAGGAATVVATVGSPHGGAYEEGLSVAKIGTDWYVIYYWESSGASSSGWDIGRYNSSWVLQASATYTPISTSDAFLYPPRIGDDGTNLLVAEWDKANNRYRIQTRNPSTLAVTSTLNTATPSLGAQVFGAPTGVLKGSYDFAGGGTHIIVQSGVYTEVFDSTGATHIYGSSFTSPSADVSGLAWDGSNFYAARTSNGFRRIYKHTAIQGYRDLNESYWATSTWRDTDGTGGTHETTMGTFQAFNDANRKRLTFTSSAIPDSGGTDDPNAVGFYITTSASTVAPTRTSFYQQTLPADGVNTVTISSVLSVTNPPSTNNFPAAVAATIKNDTATLAISGDGSINAATITKASVPVATTTGTETLTNKDLTSGTNTFPTTVLTTTGSQTVTNKNLTSTTNTFPGIPYSVAYSGNTDTAGFLTVTHGAGFTPVGGWAVTTNPGTSFVAFWGIDTIGATTCRLRFFNVNTGQLTAATAVSGRLFLVKP